MDKTKALFSAFVMTLLVLVSASASELIADTGVTAFNVSDSSFLMNDTEPYGSGFGNSSEQYQTFKFVGGGVVALDSISAYIKAETCTNYLAAVVYREDHSPGTLLTLVTNYGQGYCPSTPGWYDFDFTNQNDLIRILVPNVTYVVRFRDNTGGDLNLTWYSDGLDSYPDGESNSPSGGDYALKAYGSCGGLCEISINQTLNGATDLTTCDDDLLDIDNPMTTYRDLQVLAHHYNPGDFKNYYLCLDGGAVQASAAAQQYAPFPTFFLNDSSVSWQTCTNNGIDCYTDPGVICVNHTQDFNGFVLDDGNGDYFNFGSNIYPGSDIPTNFSHAYVWYGPQVYSYAFEEDIGIRMNIPLFLPLVFYRNPSQDILTVVARQALGNCKTPDGVFDFAPYNTPGARARYNLDSDGSFVAQADNYMGAYVVNSTERKMLVFTVPYSNFTSPETDLYTVSVAIYQSRSTLAFLDDGEMVLSASAMGQRGYNGGDDGGTDPFNMSEAIETSCDLNTTVPYGDDCVIFYGLPPAPVPELPTGMFIGLQVPFIQALAGIAVSLVALFFFMSYTKGQDGTSRIDEVFGKIAGKIK